MTPNASNCHLPVAGSKGKSMFALVDDALLWEEDSVKLLGIIISSLLKLDDHVKDI